MSAGYRKEPDKAIPIMGETEEPVPGEAGGAFIEGGAVLTVPQCAFMLG
jgi:hypothetical protein